RTGQEAVQVNAGGVRVPLEVPWKPKEVEAAGASAPL
ncbi:hypothetical protein SAMN05216251_14017, partial [Actinacidiphila alni]